MGRSCIRVGCCVSGVGKPEEVRESTWVLGFCVEKKNGTV